MVIDTYIIYESLEGLSCHNIIGGVGIPVSLRHNGLSVVRIRGSSHPCSNIQNVGNNVQQKSREKLKIKRENLLGRETHGPLDRWECGSLLWASEVAW